MFKKTLASLVLATFLVGATAAPAKAGCSGGHCGGHASGAAIGAAAGVIGGFLLAALFGKLSEEKTNRLAKSEEEETDREEIRVNAGIAHRTIGPGSVAVVTNNGYARAAVSDQPHDVLLPAEPGGY
ncbi:MAG: hypothetical protein HY470_00940 [Candidatus Ryanbacteria bacterium]|nr:hypothetical protein [Candidatus Ryanbacteria bacterium]